MMIKLLMEPAAGERALRFVGDRIHFVLRSSDQGIPPGWKAFLRTNLGRGHVVRAEIIKACTGKIPLAGASWRDIPMTKRGQEWVLDMPIVEPGYFKAKAYAIDERGRQVWPDGPDVGISIHPDAYRSNNVIYCAFARMFGRSKAASVQKDENLERHVKALDDAQFTVIPPSGKLRELTAQLPHIMDDLGCRIVHLLPVNPTPTTYARFGRFGSPYAGQDFTAIDPALVEFDRKTTGVDQFCELASAVHARDGKLFLDLVVNHTGWGSTFQENHPEWFVRNPDGTFQSPGAWGNTWEDLVELAHKTPDLWEELSGVFLVWCRRGVDGFRCDAGYKVPLPAWQYIIARVREEFPDTIFLLEGLGGAWEVTELLLAEGGMQWAYSELFQNYSGKEVSSYLDYSLRQSRRSGLWIHYSETHDNNRLAAQSREWSLLRNRLCALTSVSGGFGFTCGVEWLATEKILVHGSTGMAWGASRNIVPELRRLNRLLANHPCFFDGATLTRLSPDDSPVYALRRDSAEGADQVLVLVNTDVARRQSVAIPAQAVAGMGELKGDLLGQPALAAHWHGRDRVEFVLEPGACHCLSAQAQPVGLSGDAYRQARSKAAWALTVMASVFPLEQIGPCSWHSLARWLEETGPQRFLGCLPGVNVETLRTDCLAALREARPVFPRVAVWRREDRRRVALVLPGHWLLVLDDVPFNAVVICGGSRLRQSSTPFPQGHAACFYPGDLEGEAVLTMERFGAAESAEKASILFLWHQPMPPLNDPATRARFASKSNPGAVLLTNGRGGMARIQAGLGAIESKYDCLLGANLNASLPVDRHVFVKRARAWLLADGFLSPLDGQNLIEFSPGPPARWRFLANAGDGRSVLIDLTIDMLDGENTTVMRFQRAGTTPPRGTDLPEHYPVSLTVRLDIEDRNFHWETHRNSGADHHYATYCRPLQSGMGFEFKPAADRRLRAFADAGSFHHEGEWTERVPHPIELSRGQCGEGDAFSPGWFELPVSKGAAAHLVVSAETTDPSPEIVGSFILNREQANAQALALAGLPDGDAFGRQLAVAAQAFLARRDDSKTVIAGYPWFLDWGRDTLICARGLLAAGRIEDVKALLQIFGRYVDRGTLPNTIHGHDISNRDTSDAPLWYGMVCEEAAAIAGVGLYGLSTGSKGLALSDVLREIALGYRDGTPNGIRMDPDSGLVWSPSHFTWMDTNYPAGTPREGYPIEIQALWIRLLKQMARIEPQGIPMSSKRAMPVDWRSMASKAEASLTGLYWIEEKRYFADVLLAPAGEPARKAVRDNALRGNMLFAVSLGLVRGAKARDTVEAAARYLVVPGALRSLAPLPVSPPLPIRAADGRLLNDPNAPYWGRYEGDEDTRRKPAYHNGTAWTWTYPAFCEALAKAWENDPAAVQAARAYLGAMRVLLVEGCLGQLPEIVDGDAPHRQRGCDAQAWGVTEALRVWKLLSS